MHLLQNIICYKKVYFQGGHAIIGLIFLLVSQGCVFGIKSLFNAFFRHCVLYITQEKIYGSSCNYCTYCIGTGLYKDLHSTLITVYPRNCSITLALLFHTQTPTTSIIQWKGFLVSNMGRN